MSITFFIPGSPEREVVYPPMQEGDEEWKTTEDIWPSVNMANGNAFHYVGELANFVSGLMTTTIKPSDYCGSWTPAESQVMLDTVYERMMLGAYRADEYVRMSRFAALLTFAVAMDKTVSWG